MNITIRDCDLLICNELDKWLSDCNIVKHAMFEQTFTDEYKYYHNDKITFEELIFEKVIYLDNLLIAYVVLMFYEERGLKEVAFNPIVINPNYHNQGNGKKIATYIIDNIDSIIDRVVNFFAATISINNDISIRLFQSLGFIETGVSKDMTYVYYGLKKMNK